MEKDESDDMDAKGKGKRKLTDISEEEELFPKKRDSEGVVHDQGSSSSVQENEPAPVSLPDSVEQNNENVTETQETNLPISTTVTEEDGVKPPPQVEEGTSSSSSANQRYPALYRCVHCQRTSSDFWEWFEHQKSHGGQIEQSDTPRLMTGPSQHNYNSSDFGGFKFYRTGGFHPLNDFNDRSAAIWIQDGVRIDQQPLSTDSDLTVSDETSEEEINDGGGVENQDIDRDQDRNNEG